VIDLKMHGENMKLRPNMFRSYSVHLQGAHMFLDKVTDFKIC